VTDLQDAMLDLGPDTHGSGILDWKYIPGCAEDGAADACYSTFTPAGGSLRVTRVQTAQAQLRFLSTR
jgi:DUF971 family protein